MGVQQTLFALESISYITVFVDGVVCTFVVAMTDCIYLTGLGVGITVLPGTAVSGFETTCFALGLVICNYTIITAFTFIGITGISGIISRISNLIYTRILHTRIRYDIFDIRIFYIFYTFIYKDISCIKCLGISLADIALIPYSITTHTQSTFLVGGTESRGTTFALTTGAYPSIAVCTLLATRTLFTYRLSTIGRIGGTSTERDYQCR